MIDGLSIDDKFPSLSWSLVTIQNWSVCRGKEQATKYPGSKQMVSFPAPNKVLNNVKNLSSLMFFAFLQFYQYNLCHHHWIIP